MQMCSQTHLQNLGLILVRADATAMAFSEMEKVAVSGEVKE